VKQEELNPILDEYYCQNCDGVMRRRILYDNVTCKAHIKFCPFCGEEYELQNKT